MNDDVPSRHVRTLHDRAVQADIGYKWYRKVMTGYAKDARNETITPLSCLLVFPSLVFPLDPSTAHRPLPPPKLEGKIGLNPILFAYSTSSAFVNRSPPFQFAEDVLALNLFVRVLNSSSMLSGLIGPNSSSGFRDDCAWSACRNSGDSAHCGRLKSGDRSESSESEYLALARLEVIIIVLTLTRYRARRYPRFASPEPFHPVAIEAGLCFAAGLRRRERRSWS